MIPKHTVKYIQSLQHKKFRDEHGTFFAEGPKVVIEFLQTNLFILDTLYYTKNALPLLQQSGINILQSNMFEIADFELNKITALATANQMLAVFKQKNTTTVTSYTNKITLVLDDVQDPGNLGTIIRIADWFGIENIVCSKATADCYSPKVVQSTMASLGRVTLYYGEIEEFLKKYTTINKYAAVINGTNVEQFKGIKEGILIIGNESKGVSKNVAALCNYSISIGKYNGKAESLNAAVATGIILHSIL